MKLAHPCLQRQEVSMMTSYPRGTILTCTHTDCNCRVLIQEECRCTGAVGPSTYQRTCGAELIPAGDN